MQQLKKALSLLLVVSMLMSLSLVCVGAAEAQPTVAVGTGTLEVGKTVTVDLTLADNPGISDLSVYVFYNPAILVCAEDGGAVADDSNFKSADANGNDTVNLEYYPDKQAAGLALASFSFANKAPVDVNGKVGSLTFSLAATDIESCETALEVIASVNGVEFNGTGNKITVKGAPPTLDKVTLDKDSVTVQGGSAAAQTVQAKAIAKKTAAEVTSLATWSVTPEGKGVSVDVSGKVSVTAKAAAGTYTVKAGAKADSVQGEASATLTVARAASAVNEVKIDATPSATIAKPASGDAKTVTYTAKVLDQFGDAMTGQAITWTATGAPEKVTVANGAVTVPADAKTGSFTLTATAGGKSDSITVSVVDLIFTGADKGVTTVKDPAVGMTWGQIVKIDATKITAKLGDTVVEGTYAVTDASVKPAEGEATYSVTFTSKDGVYKNIPVVTGRKVTIIVKSVSIAAADATVAVGTKLTATISAGSATANDYNITWLRGGEVISGATGVEYTVAKADQGKAITAKAALKGGTDADVLTSNEIAVPADKPDAPVVSASVASMKVTLSWPAPADNGSPITGYTVLREDVDTVYTLKADTVTYVFTELENGTEYTFKVFATNALGDSATTQVKATPRAFVGGGGGGGGSASVGGGGSTSNTATRPDGTTVTTETGSKTTKKTITMPNGNKAVVTIDADGSATGTVTNKDGSKATVTTTKDGQTTAQVTVPSKVDKTTILIPAQKVTPGTVAVVVNKDGSEELVTLSVPGEDGVFVKLADSATVKLVDKTQRFVDTPGHWAESNAAFTSAHALFTGTDATHFSPDIFMSRAMMATVLFRLDGADKGDATENFGDVPASTWYSDAVAWAAASDIVTGYNETTFAPDDNVTREQLAAMIYRYAKAKGLVKDDAGKALTYADAASVNDWAKEAMSWLSANGLLTGKPGNLADPQGKATRAEVATVLQRFVEFAVK